jgi:hypothetical protein
LSYPAGTLADGDRWRFWCPGPGETSGVEALRRADENEASELAAWVVNGRCAELVAAGSVDVEDLWLRALVWRVGWVVDGGLTTTGPQDAPGPACTAGSCTSRASPGRGRGPYPGCSMS